MCVTRLDVRVAFGIAKERPFLYIQINTLFQLDHGDQMNQYVTDTRVSNGHLELRNVPIKDNTEVRVIVIPKANLSKMAFRRAQQLTKSIPGNLSDDITNITPILGE